MNNMSTPELLRELNTDRMARGLSPLKAWKASRLKLIEAVDALRSVAIQPLPDAIPPDEPPTNPSPLPEPKARKKKAITKDKRPQPLSDFGDYLRKHSINPRVARAKLRRHGLKGPYTLTAKVKQILKGDDQ